MAARRRAEESARLVDDGGAQSPARPGATPTGSRSQRSDSGADDERSLRDCGPRRSSRRTPEAAARLRASGHRSRHAHAVDAADGARSRRSRNRARVSRFAEDDGPATGAREEQDSPGADRVRDPGSGPDPAAPGSGARCDLRRVRQQLGGCRRHGPPRRRSGRRGDLARASTARSSARGAGSPRIAGADASLRGAPSGASQRRRKVRSAAWNRIRASGSRR